MKCPKCRSEIPDGFKFCNECGTQLTGADVISSSQVQGERKHATVLFSDLSGYTAMSESMDPEEVKNLMGRIFSASGEIVEKYGGTIDRFFGDEIMALFGVPIAHEDDPIRAIKTAMEIHSAVKAISTEYELKSGRPLRMHSGINTGLIVTGDEYIGKGRHGLTGDTINLAKRLTSLANEDDIFIGPATHEQALGHFSLEKQEPTTVKGKVDPVTVHKVLAIKDRPDTLHRTQGVRADLIGRNQEMAALVQSVEQLRNGQGGVICIVGDAGTGKSRLTREFRASLNDNQIQWHEGHAYGYSQNIPYFLLADMLTHAFQIKEGDGPGKIKGKLESGLSTLLGSDNTAVPYIGGLFSLDYAEAQAVSPDFWEGKLYESVQQILQALTSQGPTIICFEDLHWADPSTIKLLKRILADFSDSILFLCLYRPTLNLFTSNDEINQFSHFQTISLKNLDSSHSSLMLKSLLSTEVVPSHLIDTILNKVEGNPFYLEEVVNSLIEAEVLSRDNGSWRLAREITEVDIPPSIHGVLSARIDRLGENTKRLIQEASVIGRAFLYDILSRITDIKMSIDDYLDDLEQLDLIRPRSISPDLEYIFKHALTQDVVYSGLLRKERQKIHERIGFTIEKLFSDRLEEFYETLAFHFKRAGTSLSAFKYLTKAGKKCFRRYAVEEAHIHFQDAFDVVEQIEDLEEYQELKVRAVLDWAIVYYFRGDFGGLDSLLNKYTNLANTVNDKTLYGMYCAWHGFAKGGCGFMEPAYELLNKALSVSGKSDSKACGYAHTWLAWIQSGLGNLSKAMQHINEAQAVYRKMQSEHYMYFKSMGATAMVGIFSGDVSSSFKAGNELIDFGKRTSNPRAISLGYYALGVSHYIKGDFQVANECYRNGIESAKDPFYVEWSKTFYGFSLLSARQYTEAKEALSDSLAFSRKFGSLTQELFVQLGMGAIDIIDGKMASGMKRLFTVSNEANRLCLNTVKISSNYFIGKVYQQIASGEGHLSLPTLIKNFLFLIKVLPVAYKKAEIYLNKAIEQAGSINADGIVGPALLDLGRLYSAKNKKERARSCYAEAEKVFESCKADNYLEMLNEELVKLGL